MKTIEEVIREEGGHSENDKNRCAFCDGLAKAIRQYYLDLLPEKKEHHTDCLIVTLYNGTEMSACTCGTLYYNQAIQEMRERIEK